MPEILALPIESVAPDPNNARKKLTGIDELAASIEILGQLEPINVREIAPGQYVVIAGHRRLAACQKLKYSVINGIAHEDGAYDVSALAGNTGRVDLTSTEVANAVGRLAGMKISDDEISRSLTINAADVAHAKLVGKAPKKVLDKVVKEGEKSAERQLSLAELAALVEFQDDPREYENLVHEMNYQTPGEIAHTIAQIREDRKHQAAIEEAKARFGGLIIKYSRWDGPEGGAQPLFNLLDLAGNPLKSENHVDCAGRCAFVEDDGDKFAIVECCKNSHDQHPVKANPTTWGNGSQRSSGAKKSSSSAPRVLSEAEQKERDKQTLERRKTVANNKAWVPASEVRLEFVLNSLLKRAKVTDAARLFILREIAIDPDAVATAETTISAEYFSDPGLKVVGATAYGYKGHLTGAEKLAKDRLEALVLAQIVADRETTLLTFTWRPHDKERFARYFTFLQTEGYTLAEIEKGLLKAK